MSDMMAKLLPDPGAGRWWKVTHNPKSRTSPIVVTLMEPIEQRPSPTALRSRPLGRAIGFEWAIASPEKVALAAQIVLERVGDYTLVVGEYGGES